MTLLWSTPRLDGKSCLYAIVFILLLSLLIVGTPSPAHAEEERNVMDWLNNQQPSEQGDVLLGEDTNQLDNSEEKSPLFIIGQLIFYTLFILVLIYGLIKFLAVRQKKLQPNQAIKMLSGTPLGNKQSLQLIKVGGNVYLIGVSDQITLIKEFSGDDEIMKIDHDLEKQPTFLSNSLLGLSKKRPQKSQRGEFYQLFNQSLNKQKEKQDQFEKRLFEESDEEGRSR